MIRFTQMIVTLPIFLLCACSEIDSTFSQKPGTGLHIAHNAENQEIEVFAENTLQGKKVYEVKLQLIESRFYERYWALEEKEKEKAGVYSTLDFNFTRRPDVRYNQIVVYWPAKEEGMLTGILLKHGDDNRIDVETVDDKKRTISLNLKDIDPNNVKRICRVVLRYDHTLARAELDKSIYPFLSLPYNKRAWYLATFPVNAVRDGKQALADAAKAVKLDDQPALRDTLAAAYAELGDFANAKRELQRAIDSLPALEKVIIANQKNGVVNETEYQSQMIDFKQLRADLNAHMVEYNNERPVREWTYP